jgi:ribosomal protein S21
VQVLVRDNNVDQALRALKKKMQREGIFREMKMRDFYEKPSQKPGPRKGRSRSPRPQAGPQAGAARRPYRWRSHRSAFSLIQPFFCPFRVA